MLLGKAMLTDPSALMSAGMLTPVFDRRWPVDIYYNVMDTGMIKNNE